MSSGQQDTSRPRKCVVIGDACVGKTCMVARLVGKKPNMNEYEPTIEQSFPVSLMYRGQPCRLEICDTAGQEDYANLRSASYAHTDLFLLCFSLENRVSFENLEAAWLQELRKHREAAPVLLVGTKLDQYKEDRPVITKAEINALSSKNGFEYVQCSALDMTGIQDVIDKLLDVLHGVTVRPIRRKSGLKLGKCSIL